MTFTRRRFLAVGSAGLLLPAPGLAAPVTAQERRFLFVFCNGGWDVGMLFSPVFSNSAIDVEPGLEPAEVGGITYGRHDDRPMVDAFFAEYAPRTCVINGLEARSIVHDKCNQLIMTGAASAGRDDWGTILGAHASSGTLLPYLHIDGPLYTAQYPQFAIRLGSNGQLSALLSGSALQESDLIAQTSLTDTAEQDFLQQQAAALLEMGGSGQDAAWLATYQDTLSQTNALQMESGQLDLAAATTFPEQLGLAMDAMQQGVCRCAITRYGGPFGQSWDSHTLNELQSLHFEELFDYLTDLMGELDQRIGVSNRRLSDEVTVVVISEMGRHPTLNFSGGRDHWTFTSAMLIGSGVAGGQSIGGLSSDFMGEPIDLSSGERTDAGTDLQAGHLGATILRLGGVDPAEYLVDLEPIMAALS